MIPLIMILLPVAAVAVAVSFAPAAAVPLVIVALVAFVVLAGKKITNIWFGALIDERNMASLARFQTVLWTVLVVSAVLVAVFRNIRIGDADPLNIVVPPELWILLGISVTSLVGSGLIKGEQAKAKPEETAAVSALSEDSSLAGDSITPMGVNRIEGTRSGESQQEVVARGVLRVNGTADQASWLDMFKAEQITGAGRLDLGKIQMFFFTIAIVGSYGAAVVVLFGTTPGRIDQLPVLNQSVIALLGISHAGYLANKAAVRTPTTG